MRKPLNQDQMGIKTEIEFNWKTKYCDGEEEKLIKLLNRVKLLQDLKKKTQTGQNKHLKYKKINKYKKWGWLCALFSPVTFIVILVD